MIGRVALLLAAAMSCGCRTREEATRAPEPPRPSPAPTTPAPLSSVDTVLKEYEKALPPALTISEQNGASLTCPKHGDATYTHLHGLSQRLGIASDSELPALVQWAKSADVCVRYIAVEAIVERIKFDSNRVALPGMHEPEHYYFHDIMVSLRTHLATHKVAVDPQVFSGMMLDITPKDFAMMKGTWQEDPSSLKSFHTTVSFDGTDLRVLTKHDTVDPAWPDHTWTTRVAGVTVNERAQFVVDGAWNIESNAKGYVGTKITPSQFTYRFWPIGNDVVWFDEGSGSWTALHRVK